MLKKTALVFIVFIAAFASAQITPDAAKVMDKVRASIGYEHLQEAMKKTGGMSLTGKADYLGTKGTYSLLFSSAAEFLEEIKTNLGQTAGFDGKTGWATDFTGMPRILELEDLETQQAIMWVYSGYWLSKAQPFAVSTISATPAAQNLKIKLKNGLFVATLAVDTQTWRPTKLTHKSSAGDEVWEFSDYQQTNDIFIAHTVKDTNGGLTNTVEIDKVGPAPIFIRNPYSPLLIPPKDTTFDPIKPNAVEMKRAFTGHLLIHPMVDGKDVGWFILDSGAGSMVLDKAIADDMKLLSIGQVPVVGVGGIVRGAFRKADSFTFGPMTFRNPLFVELDLAGISSIFGVKLAGICGYDVFARSVIQVNIMDKKMSVHNADTFKLPAGKWQTIMLDGKHPVVKAKFEGNREGLFRLDTGAGNTLTFHYPAVQKYKLLDGRKVVATKLGGVGGFMDAKAGRIDWFELAGHRFSKPYVEFSLSKDGPLADEYTVGNMGQQLLLPFTLVFDYPHKRMAFIAKK